MQVDAVGSCGVEQSRLVVVIVIIAKLTFSGACQVKVCHCCEKVVVVAYSTIQGTARFTQQVRHERRGTVCARTVRKADKLSFIIVAQSLQVWHDTAVRTLNSTDGIQQVGIFSN